MNTKWALAFLIVSSMFSMEELLITNRLMIKDQLKWSCLEILELGRLDNILQIC